MGEEFILDIISILNEKASKKRIKDGLKGMDNSMYVKVISKLSMALSKRQLKKDLKQLNDLYLQIGADLKIDNNLKKKLEDRIKTLQNGISDLQIDVSAKSSDITKTVTEIRNKGQRQAGKASIDFNIEVKKEKAIADLEYIAKKYSKLFSNASASQKYSNIFDAAQGITNSKELSNVRAQIAAFTSELKANGLATQSLGDRWKNLVTKCKDLFSAATLIRIAFTQARQAISTTLDLDKVYTDLIKVNNELNRNDYTDYLSRINQKAKELATTQKGLIEGATEFSKSGFNLSTSNKLSEISTILANVGEMSDSDSAKAIISGVQAYDVIDGYDDVIDKANALIDKYNEIGNTASITTAEIAQGVQKVGSVFADANTSVDEFIALLSAGNRQFQDADNLSLALRTAALRIRGCSAELETMGEETDSVYTSTAKLAEKIEGLTNINGTGGVKILENDEETFRSIYEVFLDISKVYRDMSDTDASALLELIAGKNRASAISATLNNMSEAEEILQNSINAAGSAQKEYNAYLKSTEAHIAKFKATLVETYSTFMNGDMISYTADMGNAILDLVNSTDLLKHSILAVLSLNIGKGITSVGASIASTTKQFNMLGSALQQVKNLPTDFTRVDVLEQVGNATKSLTEKNLKLLLSQKQLKDTDREAILCAHNLTSEEAKAKLEKMGLLTVTKQQTTANVAEAATTGTLKNAMLSLKASVSEVGATIKGMFASNPIGMGLLLISTAFSVFSTVISKTNEKLEETRRANIESATTASENADKLKDLYNEYTRLASIQDRTTSEEEAFKTAVENITVALGDKAEILKDLTAGTDEYADALARVTKEELQSQAVTATIGRKSAEEELQGEIWGSVKGSKVSIDSNSKGKALSDEAQKAVDIVSDSLKEFETINRTWKNISWDISSNDPTEALEFYNSLVEAREKLVLASEDDEALLDTEIYKDLNTAINTMSESLDTYIGKLYEEEKLNYMAQNGIPSVTEEYKAMESALVSAAGSSVDLQDRFKELLMSDFSSLATDIGNVGNTVEDVSAQAEKAIPLFDQLTSSEEALDTFQTSVKSATDAYSTLLSGNYSSTELLDCIQDINKAMSDMGGSLNWEFINSQTDSLELLGDAIQHVSQKYAESILSDAGIDIDSEFGQMLASIIQQIYDAEAAFEGMNSQLDNLQSSYQTLTGILESYNETGYISLDNLQSLLTADENLIQMLQVENGQLVLNQQAYENLVAVQLLEFKAKLNDAAAAEIEMLAKQKAEQATNQNADASQNAVAKLDAETQAFNRNTTAAIANAVAKAEESGVSEAEIQGIFDKYTEVWNSAMSNYNVDFDSFMSGGKSAASKAGGEHADAYLEAFEEEYSHLKDLLNRGEISEAQYLSKLRALYTRYFKDRKEYLDEFKKYESEYLSGMLDLHNKALSGISTLLNRKISAANDAKDASISALEEEKEKAAEVYQSQIDNIEKEKDAIDDLIKEKNKKIDAINEEIDAIERAAETRKKNIDLQQQEYNLQKMLNNRSSMVYKDGQFVFETDTSGVRDAREKVKEAQEALQIDSLKNEISLIQKEIDLLEEKKDALSEEQERIQQLMDESNKYYDNFIKEQQKMWDSMIENMEQQKSRWEELAEVKEIAEAYSAIEQVFGELGYSVEDILNGSESAFEDFKSRYIAIMSDMNQNTSFQEGLEYASGVAKENFGSIVSDAQSAAQELSDTFSDGSFAQAVTQGVSDGIVSAKQELDNMGQLGRDAGDGLINGWDEKVSTFIEAVKQAAINAVEAFAEGQDSHSPSEAYKSKAGDAIDGLLLGIEENKQAFIDTVRSLAEEGILAFEEGFNFENSTINASFDSLKFLIESVTEALGIGTEGTAGLLGALDQLSKFTFSEDSIVKQFTNLKTAIDSVSSAISGGGGESSGGENQSSSSSAKGGESGGKSSEGSGGGNSLTGAIEQMGETANTIIGEPDAEGDGTVIGEFGAMETAVNDVTTAIGGGDSEDGEGQGSSGESEGNLIGSITDLGTTTEETLGESGGDGVIGKFEELKQPIQEADEHVHGISSGLDEIDGKEVECTIKVNIETSGSLPAFATGTALDSMNLNSAEYNAKYSGSAHAGGTALASGNWAVQSNENSALVGEEGFEIIVRNGRFFTVGDNGAEMTNIQKGDIVFNHEQSVELLKHGHISGRGKAYADGTVGGGKILTPDGKILRPLQPGDREYELQKAFEPLIAKMREGAEVFSNAAFEHQKQMEKWTKEITNNTAINNVVNNRNVQQPVTIHQNVTVNCPNVTNDSGVENIQKQLGHLSQKAYQVQLREDY